MDANRTKEEKPRAKDQPEKTEPSATPESAKEQPERESNDQGNNFILERK